MKKPAVFCSIPCVFLILVALSFLALTPPSQARGGKSSGGGRSGGGRGAKIGFLAAGTGFATYAAYKAAPRENQLVDLYATPYNAQESVYSRKPRGPGMKASTIIFLILGIIGLTFGTWCCYNVCIPFWRDTRKSSRRRDSQIAQLTSVKIQHEELPLQDTPSTATPSP